MVVTNNCQKINYQLLTDRIIAKSEGENRKPRLLLHCCCAPCSSYVLEYLTRYFDITAFFYNPNINIEDEYRHRAEELRRLIREMGLEQEVTYLEGKYEPERFETEVKGLEQEKEGQGRCAKCFMLRLRETARLAAENGFDYFTTTLTISPLKNAALLNETGFALAEKYNISWLPSDFKKRGGYQRSIELSAKYGLYRQNYCGCTYSRDAAN